MKGKISYAKGLALEQKFSEYLKTEMKYEKIKIRTQISALGNKRGSNIDIIGERESEKGIRLKKIGLIYLICCAGLFLIGLLLGYSNNWRNGFWQMLLILALIFEAGAGLALWLKRKNEKEHIWVECKDLQTKTNINQVRKMIDEIAEYKASGDKQYNFIEYLFVSSQGFIENAIQKAEENGIQCYIKDGKSFRKITQWS